jgi:hypothetical protein
LHQERFHLIWWVFHLASPSHLPQTKKHLSLVKVQQLTDKSQSIRLVMPDYSMSNKSACNSRMIAWQSTAIKMLICRTEPVGEMDEILSQTILAQLHFQNVQLVNLPINGVLV